MKKFKYITILFFLGAFLFVSCNKETMGISKEAKTPEIAIKGSAIYLSPFGKSYVEPGYEASFDGKDYSDRVEVKGYVDVSKMGSYPLKYLVRTDDGLYAFASRTVIVPNPAPSHLESRVFDIDGVKTHRVNAAGTKTVYGGNFSIYLYQTDRDGEFFVSDFLGGYYDQRAGYGSNYAAPGTMKVNDDNTFTLLSSGVKGWGDALSNLSGGISPDGEIYWVAEYAGMKFNIFLKK